MSANDRHRVYGHEDRTAFVNSLPCVACSTTSARRQNHHTATGGKGFKANALSIVPLCWQCHVDVHTQGKDTFARRHRLDWATTAHRIETLWQWRAQHDFRNLTYTKDVDMAIVRWSSDYFRSDVYVYEVDDNMLTVHVAGRRYEGIVPPKEPADLNDTEAWLEEYRDIQRQIRTANLVAIEHELAGQSFYSLTKEECAALLRKLEAEGFRIPAGTIEEVETLPTEAA